MIYSWLAQAIWSGSGFIWAVSSLWGRLPSLQGLPLLDCLFPGIRSHKPSPQWVTAEDSALPLSAGWYPFKRWLLILVLRAPLGSPPNCILLKCPVSLSGTNRVPVLMGGEHFRLVMLVVMPASWTLCPKQSSIFFSFCLMFSFLCIFGVCILIITGKQKRYLSHVRVCIFSQDTIDLSLLFPQCCCFVGRTIWFVYWFSLDFSSECEKMPGLFAEVAGLKWVGFGPAGLGSPANVRGLAHAPLLGRWSLARPFCWHCLGAVLLVTVGGFPSAVGKRILS